MDKLLQNDLKKLIQSRKDDGSYRKLQSENNLYDFSSNDYLGFAQSDELKDEIALEMEKFPESLLGARGSRLLSGNTEYAEMLESELALIHQTSHGLLFNSGYAANLALFSSVPQKHDTIICDEYIHASVIDGCRLSFANRFNFRHNDLDDLEKKIKNSTGQVYVAVESVYSMEGDLGDLINIALLCRNYGARLIVDEAHALGVFGTGLVDMLEIQHSVFARVVTFGKALGLHGAIVLGSRILREYLINFARPFIYSTAQPFSQLLAIKVAYKRLLDRPDDQFFLQRKCTLLKDNLPPQHQMRSSKNPSAIQFIYADGNDEALWLSSSLQESGFDIRAIRSPSVPKGKERLRICLHTYNSDEEIFALCRHIHLLSTSYAN